MRFLRKIILLLGLLIIFEGSGICQEKEPSSKVNKADSQEFLLQKQTQFGSCPYVIGGIPIVPTFPPIFVADENGKIRVDRNLHCGKSKNRKYNGPVLNRKKKPQRHKGHKEQKKSLCSLCLYGFFFFSTTSYYLAAH